MGSLDENYFVMEAEHDRAQRDNSFIKREFVINGAVICRRGWLQTGSRFKSSAPFLDNCNLTFSSLSPTFCIGQKGCTSFVEGVTMAPKRKFFGLSVFSPSHIDGQPAANSLRLLEHAVLQQVQCHSTNSSLSPPLVKRHLAILAGANEQINAVAALNDRRAFHSIYRHLSGQKFQHVADAGKREPLRPFAFSRKHSGRVPRNAMAYAPAIANDNRYHL